MLNSGQLGNLFYILSLQKSSDTDDSDHGADLNWLPNPDDIYGKEEQEEGEEEDNDGGLTEAIHRQVNAAKTPTKVLFKTTIFFQQQDGKEKVEVVGKGKSCCEETQARQP